MLSALLIGVRDDRAGSVSGQPWPRAQRAEATQLAAEVGAAEACRRTGVPAATLRSWVKRATDAGIEVVPAGDVEIVQGSTLAWPERRRLLADRLHDLAVVSATAAREAVEDGATRKAKDLSVVFGIATDKALLLSGGATRRTETRNENLNVHVGRTDPAVAAEITRLRKELGLDE